MSTGHRLAVMICLMVNQAAGATTCSAAWAKCAQTVQMNIASGVPSDDLNPASTITSPPAILSTPASPFTVVKSNDTTAISARPAGRQPLTAGQAHYCSIPATVAGGPLFGQCLPVGCSADEYQFLAINCSVARMSRSLRTITKELQQVQRSVSELDAAINGTLSNVTGANATRLEQLTHQVEELLLKLGVQALGVNISSEQINEILNDLSNGTLASLGDQLEQVAQTVDYFGAKFLGSHSGFCSDDKFATVDASAGLLIAFSAFMGGLCLVCTFYELLVLPHVLGAQPDFDNNDLRKSGPGMGWLLTLQPEHLAYIKHSKFSTPIYRVAKMFSLYSHTATMLQKRTQGDFKALNGIRTLSTGYIVLGHLYLVVGLMGSTVNKVPKVNDFATSWNAIIITGSFLSVDTFYFLSGFLGGYIMIRTIEKLKSWMDLLKAYPVLIAHRYLRLTPIYAYVLWWYISGVPLLVTGPAAGNPAITTPDKFCTEHWFENLLYVNTIVPTDRHGTDTCMGWSWYLANDMMFYLLIPPILYIYKRYRLAGAAVLAAIVLGIRFTHKIGISSVAIDDKNYGIYLYARPWTRCAPCFIGVALGLYFHERKKRLAEMQPEPDAGQAKAPVTLAQPMTVLHFVVYWICGITMALMAFILPWWAAKDDKNGVMGRGAWSQTGNDFFNALQRPLFTVGLGGMVHMFASGHGSICKQFLEHPVFDVLANLTYGLYLWALLIMEVYSRLYIGCMGLGFLVSYLSFVIIELPFAALAAKILPSKRAAAKPKPPPKQDDDKEINELCDPEDLRRRQPLINREDAR